MGQSIATLDQVLGRAAKFHRVLREAGLRDEMLDLPVNDPTARERLVEFLNSGCPVSRASSANWTEENGVISFTLVSDGTSGKDWIPRLEKKGFRVGDCAMFILLSSDFKPTKGVEYKVRVLKGSLFSDKERTTANVRAEAEKRGLSTPNAEVACLIREHFSDEELRQMDLWWIIVMHDPIKDSGDDPCLLSVSRYGLGRGLIANYDRPDDRLGSDRGLAFVASQVSSQS